MKVYIIKTFHTPSQTDQYFWQVRSRNGKIVGTTGEGYQKLSHCLKMVSKLFGDKFKIVMPKDKP